MQLIAIKSQSVYIFTNQNASLSLLLGSLFQEFYCNSVNRFTSFLFDLIIHWSSPNDGFIIP